MLWLLLEVSTRHLLRVLLHSNYTDGVFPPNTKVLEEGCCEMFCDAVISPEHCSLSRLLVLQQCVLFLYHFRCSSLQLKKLNQLHAVLKKVLCSEGASPHSQVLLFYHLTEEKEWWECKALLIKFIASIVPYIWRIPNYKYSPFYFFSNSVSSLHRYLQIR